MEKWDFLNNIQKSYGIVLRMGKDMVSIVNPNNEKCINVYEEKYYSSEGQDIFIEYIVCFATQHRHFEDLDEVEEYVHMILQDEILAIEFYDSDDRRFGGEIGKVDYETLSQTLLAQRWGYPIEYLSARDYEVYSWSGRYDSGRKKVADIK